MAIESFFGLKKILISILNTMDVICVGYHQLTIENMKISSHFILTGLHLQEPDIILGFVLVSIALAMT